MLLRSDFRQILAVSLPMRLLFYTQFCMKQHYSGQPLGHGAQAAQYARLNAPPKPRTPLSIDHSMNGGRIEKELSEKGNVRFAGHSHHRETPTSAITPSSIASSTSAFLVRAITAAQHAYTPAKSEPDDKEWLFLNTLVLEIKQEQAYRFFYTNSTHAPEQERAAAGGEHIDFATLRDSAFNNTLLFILCLYRVSQKSCRHFDCSFAY